MDHFVVLQVSCWLISCGRNSERSQMVWLPLWPKSWLSPESLWLSFLQIVDVYKAIGFGIRHPQFYR
jgi:hypothetical protein